MPCILALCADVPEKFRRVPAGLASYVITEGAMRKTFSALDFDFCIYIDLYHRSWRVRVGLRRERLRAKPRQRTRVFAGTHVVVSGTVVTNNDF